MIPLGMILFPLIYTLLDNLIYILPLLLLGGLIYCLVQMFSDSDVKRSCESFAKEVKSNCEHFVGEARKRRECFTGIDWKQKWIVLEDCVYLMRKV